LSAPGAEPDRRPERLPLVRTVKLSASVAVLMIAAFAGTRLLGVGASAADEPHYATTDPAPVILRGTITATHDYDRDGAPETEATVAVSKVAKGEVAAGRPATVVYTRIGSGPEAPVGLHRGGEYVFLLTPRDSSRWNLINSDQGYFAVSAGNAVPLSDGVRQRLGLP
jgi:hypothetical protein